MERLYKAQGFYAQEAEGADAETRQELLSFIRGEYFQDEPTPEEDRWLLSEKELLEISQE